VSRVTSLSICCAFAGLIAVGTSLALARVQAVGDAGLYPGGAGDPTRGAALFDKRCTGCHSLTQNHQGPRLQGVYGRTSGSIADYAYSQALKKSNVLWDQTTLDKWLSDPDAFIPGNEMDFLVSKPQERLDLIAFLKQASGK